MPRQRRAPRGTRARPRPGMPVLAQRRDGRAVARFESFCPSSPRISPWWTNSGGVAPSASKSRRCSGLVRPVVVAADDVRDPEVDVVDDASRAGTSASRPRAASVIPLEAVAPPSERRLRRLAVPVGALALAHRPLVPRDPEPLEVGEDRLLPARDVARRIGVVDPQQQPARRRRAPVRDRAERVADVERARRARCEADFDHRPSLGLSSARDGILARNSSPPKRLVRRFPPQRPREAAGRDAFRPDNRRCTSRCLCHIAPSSN